MKAALTSAEHGMCPRATWVPNLGHPLGLSPSEAPANPERQSAASLLPGEGSGPQLLEAGSPQLLSGEGKPRLGLAAVGQGQVSCCWGGVGGLHSRLLLFFEGD